MSAEVLAEDSRVQKEGPKLCSKLWPEEDDLLLAGGGLGGGAQAGGQDLGDRGWSALHVTSPICPGYCCD